LSHFCTFFLLNPSVCLPRCDYCCTRQHTVIILAPEKAGNFGIGMSDLQNDLTEVPGANVGVWVYNPKSNSYELAAQWPEKVITPDGSEKPSTWVRGIRLKRSDDGVSWRPRLYLRYAMASGSITERPIKKWKWHGTPPPDGKIVVLECLEPVFRGCVENAMDLLAAVKDDMQHRPMGKEDLARTEREFVTIQRLKSYKPKEKRRNRERFPRLSELWERFKPKAEEEAMERQDEFKRPEFYRYVIQRFADFAIARHAKSFFLAEVPFEDVTAYLKGLEAEVAPGTYNKHLIVLKRLFRLLAPFSAAAGKLDRVKQKNEENVLHEPFSDAEVDSIIEMAAQVDSLIRSMVIVAVCTGLRLKDICLLKWSCMDTDFSKVEPLMNLTTHKNKGDAILGMWPLLKTELERLWKAREPGAVYVLPEAAAIYQRNVKPLLTRLEKVLKLLGYGEEGMDARRVSLNMEPEPDRAALMSQVEAALVAAGDCPEGRRRSILNVLDLYLNGKSLPQIAASSGLCKGTVSNYLHRAEKLTGRIIIRQRVMPVVFQGDTPKPLTVKPERAGTNRIAVRKWHSFRTTFFIAAVRAEIKIELLKKILGSRTVDVLYKHYFRLNKELIHEGFTTKVPAYALNKVAGSPALPDAPRMVNATPAENRLKLAAARLKTLTPENANELRNELLKLLED